MAVSAASGTVREALTAATDAIAAAGVESPRLDAELLLAEATGLDRARLAADPEGGIEPPAARRFGEMVRRRVRHEPVAYILGRKGFRRLELSVDRRVLIPRPETELLVEVAVELRPRTVLDVGTGSGAVALAVADELPDLAVRGTDTSPDAIAVARQNATRLGLAERATFDVVATSFGYSETSRQSAERYDLVLANLPYVPEGEWGSLPPEIRDYEPSAALIAGPDGLEAIRALLADLPHCNAIALEVGLGQAREVSGLVGAAGFDRVESRNDLAGIERVVLGRR
jgi:release factor glutamine methyltransferase